MANARAKLRDPAQVVVVTRDKRRKYPPAKVGDRYGEWTVIAYWRPDALYRRQMAVLCSCGVWGVRREHDLLSGRTRSCGHLVRNLPGSVRGVRRRVAEVVARVRAMEINVHRSPRCPKIG